MTAAQQPEQETGSAVARTEKNAVVRLLDSDDARRRIVPMLSGGASYERVMTEVYLAAQKNADILKCKPLSIVQAVARAVGTGGRIGTDIHLVPFGDTLTVVEDYKFLGEIIVRSGGARSIVSKCVYQNDEFSYVDGTHPELRHAPAFGSKGARGPLIGAYAVAHLGVRTPPKILVMSVEEIDRIRLKHSRSWKKGPLEDIPWYAEKTVVRQIAKLLPSNPRLAAALARLGLGNGEEVELEELPLPTEEAEPVMTYPLRQRPEAPRVEITGSTADPALVEHFASQPDPYTGEAGELPLGDAKQAPGRDALKEG
jgi:phage RecT family recombinase